MSKKNALLERITDRFAARPLQKIDVPEWAPEDTPTTDEAAAGAGAMEDGGAGMADAPETAKPVFCIYYRVPSLAQMGRAGKGDPMQQTARLVAMVVCDKNGKPLFEPADWVDLHERCDPAVMQRIGSDIMKKAGFSVEEAEKNSEAIPSA